MVEFEERFNGKEDVNVETRGVSEVKKRGCGVTKRGNKWRARVRNPKLKVDVHLGHYSNPEEAALAVKNKKAEFKELFKGENCSSMKTCRDESEGRKLPFGVRRQHGKYRVRIWHPELKKFASFGYYSTCEEAAIVAIKKRAEFREVYGGKPRVIPDSEDNDDILREPKSEVASKSKCSDRQTGDVKVPAGVRRIKSGKWVARIKDPASRSRIWVGTYNTAKEAIRSFNRKKAILATKTERVEFDGCPTSLLGADNLNSNALDDKSGFGVVSFPDKPENSNSASVSDKRAIGEGSHPETSYALDFDRAVDLGFINEYGQLMGKYCELDEQMWLSLPDEILDSGEDRCRC